MAQADDGEIFLTERIDHRVLHFKFVNDLSEGFAPISLLNAILALFHLFVILNFIALSVQDQFEIDELLDLVHCFLITPRERRNSAIHLLHTIGVFRDEHGVVRTSQEEETKNEKTFVNHLERLYDYLPDYLMLPKKRVPQEPDDAPIKHMPYKPPREVLKNKVFQMKNSGGDNLSKSEFLLKKLNNSKERRRRAWLKAKQLEEAKHLNEAGPDHFTRTFLNRKATNETINSNMSRLSSNSNSHHHDKADELVKKVEEGKTDQGGWADSMKERIREGIQRSRVNRASEYHKLMIGIKKKEASGGLYDPETNALTLTEHQMTALGLGTKETTVMGQEMIYGMGTVGQNLRTE